MLFDTESMNDLTEEDLYILCSILFHHEISLDYLSEDMNLTGLETRMRVDRLKNRNIIESAGNRTTFTIAPLALSTTLKVLSKRNLVNLEI